MPVSNLFYFISYEYGGPEAYAVHHKLKPNYVLSKFIHGNIYHHKKFLKETR